MPHMATQFGGKNPWTECSSAEVKVMQGSLTFLDLRRWFGCYWAFLGNLISGQFQLTPHQGFFQPNSTISNSTSCWTRLVPSWTLTPVIYLPVRVLPTKFGIHRAFLINLTPSWPWLTPAWHLIPGMYYTSVRTGGVGIAYFNMATRGVAGRKCDR